MADERQYQQPTRRSRTGEAAARSPRKAPRPLSEAERAQVEQTCTDVYEHFPELIPTIKEFADAGLIDGWRNVTIKVTKNGTD